MARKKSDEKPSEEESPSPQAAPQAAPAPDADDDILSDDDGKGGPPQADSAPAPENSPEAPKAPENAPDAPKGVEGESTVPGSGDGSESPVGIVGAIVGDVPEEKPTLARDDPKPDGSTPEVDPNRAARPGEVKANQRIQDAKGDLAPMQPTAPIMAPIQPQQPPTLSPYVSTEKPQAAPEPQAAATVAERPKLYKVERGRVGSYGVGSIVTLAMLNTTEANANRMIDNGILSEVDPR